MSSIAELEEKSPILEHRSETYLKTYVSNETQKIGDFYQDSVELMMPPYHKSRYI